MLRNIFIVFAFVLWILPLGVFIKPIDEKKVCDGKRAICMCSHMVKTKTGAAKKFLKVHVPISEKDTSSSGSSNYLAAELKDINSFSGSQFLNHIPNLYSFAVSKSVEHVPKV
ncbi:MAG: hypothetical protein H6754_03565 [Candidatus Omnitrophica bacterium]|nr:hypothetical protein [Candidatus Omnitrophota bacterium]